MLLVRASLLLVFACVVFAQEFRATLQGTVTDPTRAAVPGAQVTLRNMDTAIERKTSTDEAGHYLFSFVTPGTYSLSISAGGFRTRVQERILLDLNENARQDVELTLGTSAETISVVADVSVVQPESSSLGSVIPEGVIAELPFKGHSSLTMYNLAAGVVANRYGEDTRPSDLFTNVLFAANGAPDSSSDVSVDGVPNTIDLNRSASVSWWVPAMESVAEFKLQMGTLPAEYGRSAGSLMNVVIKSGTNTPHGAAYEFFRNSALDANLFFARGQGQKLPAFGVNMFGASLGGPIWLPKIYDGKSRSFFFVSFEGSREGNGTDYTYSVPTAKMRSGDFSEVSSPIYNPFSVHTVNGVPMRDPFAGNIIPQSVQDPVGQKMITYWPQPNRPTTAPATPWVQNSEFASKWPRNGDMTVVKLDHQFSPRNQSFFRLNKGSAQLIYPYYFEGPAVSGRDINTRPNFGGAIGETFSISARTTWDTRIGFARGIEEFRPWSQGFDLTQLGFSSAYQNLVQYRAFPGVSVTGFQSLGGSRWYEQPGDTWSLQSSVSMQRGKHLFKTGGDARLVRGNWFTATNTSGSFSFGTTQSGGPRADAPSAGTGFGMASLLLGYGSGSLPWNTGLAVRDLYYALYFQDDYRVTRRLTLNLGLRWEYPVARTERYDRMVRGFARNAQNPLQVPGMTLRGGLLYAGVNGQPRGLYDPDYNNFAPRFGFAYSLTSKTVLRGGYALSYIPVLGAVQSLGYSSTTPWVSSTDGGITPKDLLRNPFPNGLIPLTGNSQGLLTLVGQSVTFVDPTDRTPMFHNWQFNIQRELPSQTLVEAAYVGSRAIRIFGGLDANTGMVEQLNQLNPQYLSMGTDLLKTVTNPFYGIITSGSLSGATVQQSQLLLPYPEFTGVARRTPAFGNSVYHSAQFRLEKRMAQGITALVLFTISKNIGDITTAQNAYNRQLERAVTSFDVPERLNVSFTWELPFGRGRHFLNGIGRTADLFIGGWQLTNYDTFQAGFGMGFGLVKAAAGSGGNRPNVVGDPWAGMSGNIQSRLNRYFNTSAFAQPADFTFGNASPRISQVRSPGMNDVHLTLSKTFQIVEKLKLQFRASSFNLMNTPVFSAPNTTLGDANFGHILSQANQSRQTELALKLVW